MSHEVVISGAGLWKPPHIISNAELVDSYNAWAEAFNARNAAAIEAGELEAKLYSSVEFIEKASGIRQRYAYEKSGILDVERMRPRLEVRAEDALSHQAEIALQAARPALEAAGRLDADGRGLFRVLRTRDGLTLLDGRNHFLQLLGRGHLRWVVRVFVDFVELREAVAACQDEGDGQNRSGEQGES